MTDKFTKLQLVTILLMIALSFVPFWGFGFAGISVLLGIAVFFIDKGIRKVPYTDCGFDIRLIGKNLKDKGIFIWILLPLVSSSATVVFAKLFLPEFIPHVLDRVSDFITLENIMPLFFQLVVLALGEEIAWRAFFQNQISKRIPIAPAIVITSALFSIAHLSSGSLAIILYDMVFIFINSVIYGIAFHKTKNAWISYFAHLLANIAGITLLLIFQ